MGRVLVALAVLVALVLALDFAGILDLGVFSSDRAVDGDGQDLLSADDDDGDARVALRGRGDEAPSGDSEQTPEAAEAPEVLSDVRGSRPNGGVIHGRVVQGTPPLPVAGVRVTLDRPDSIFTYLRAEVNGRFDRLEARTDDAGRFAFRDLIPSKDYVVRATHPKFAVSSSGKIDLRAGGTTDLGDLPLTAGGQIIGRIVDVREEPIEGARVVVTWRITNSLNSILTDPGELPEIEAETVTASDGTFRVERVEPGTKTLVVSAPSGASDARPSFPVEGGQTSDLGDWRVGGTRFLGGRVLWSDGTPVPDVRVVAAPFGRPVGRQTLTDAEGRFRLDHLPDVKNYAVGTMVPGLPVSLLLNVKLDSDDLEVRIPTPARLHGRVVTEEGGQPVPKFRILTKQKPTGNFIQDMVARAVTTALGATPFEDPQGRFSFPRMPVGSFTIEVTAAGHPPRSQEVSIAVGDDKELTIKLPSGKRAAGRVVDATGAPVQTARLYVLPAGDAEKMDPDDVERSLRSRTPDGVSDASGNFQLPPQAPGQYDLVATADDELPGVLPAVRLGHDHVEGLHLQLPPSAVIEGRATDPQGQPPSGSVGIVAVFGDFSTRFTNSEADGSFRFAAVPVGPVVVRWRFEVDQSILMDLDRHAKAPDKAEAAYRAVLDGAEERTTRSGQTLTVTVLLPRRTLVKGRVVSAGAPAKGVRGVYFLKQPGGQRWQWVDCDDKGRFTRPLVPSTYQVYVPTASDRWIPQEVVVPDLSEMDLELERPADGG